MLVQPGKRYRFFTSDNLRYGGEVLEFSDGIILLHDEKTRRDVLLAVGDLRRAEEQP